MGRKVWRRNLRPSDLTNSPLRTIWRWWRRRRGIRPAKCQNEAVNKVINHRTCSSGISALCNLRVSFCRADLSTILPSALNTVCRWTNTKANDLVWLSLSCLLLLLLLLLPKEKLLIKTARFGPTLPLSMVIPSNNSSHMHVIWRVARVECISCPSGHSFARLLLFSPEQTDTCTHQHVDKWKIRNPQSVRGLLDISSLSTDSFFPLLILTIVCRDKRF